MKKAIAALTVLVLLCLTGSARAENPDMVQQVTNCARVAKVYMFDGSRLVAVGTRVAMPPYLCRFNWEYIR